MDSGWAWAAKHNALRVNEIHGEEEAKLILDDTFAFTEEEGELHQRESVMTLEALWPLHACLSALCLRTRMALCLLVDSAV